MYAMLTGTLPFTVAPFSLRALYQKMVDKEMNPLPTQLSTGTAPATPIQGPRLLSNHHCCICFAALGRPCDCTVSLPSTETKSPETRGGSSRCGSVGEGPNEYPRGCRLDPWPRSVG